jgi:hypothetical protein
MVKRTLHIGTFLQRQHVSDVSLAGIFPMCGGSSTHLQKMFFLRSIARRLTTILPVMTLAEAIETTRIHSLADLTGERPALMAMPAEGPAPPQRH